MGCFRDPATAELECPNGGGGFVVSPNPPTCEDFDEVAAAVEDPESSNSMACTNWLASTPPRNACPP